MYHISYTSPIIKKNPFNVRKEDDNECDQSLISYKYMLYINLFTRQ